MWGGGGLYNAWATFLQRWGAGENLDPASLPALSREDFNSDGWGRLTNRLTDALSQRLRLWADGLSGGLGEARDEFGVSRALAQARLGLRPIRGLAAHPALTPELASGLRDLVDRQIRSAQQMLEDQVESMRRSGVNRSIVEARLRTIRDNALTVASDGRPDAPVPPADAAVRPPGGPVPTTDAWFVDPSATPRRRILD